MLSEVELVPPVDRRNVKRRGTRLVALYETRYAKVILSTPSNILSEPSWSFTAQFSSTTARSAVDYAGVSPMTHCGEPSESSKALQYMRTSASDMHSYFLFPYRFTCLHELGPTP